MNIPQQNLNIAFIGEVSTGKSTILNGIYCREITQSSIKRTTMCPSIFIENKDLKDTDIDEKKIYEEIKLKNQEIIKDTEQGFKLENCQELIFNVGKLDLNILENNSVNVYDIPGLNDARTKELYYNYLRTNFYKFNIIIFLVDINSGLNTSDEIDILRLITGNTIYQKEENKKNIYTLVVVNKADDMQIKIDPDTNNEILYLDDELNEMFQQVNLTVKDEFQKSNISEHLIDIIPLCGLDSYLYRMIRKFGNTYHLKDADILKIGINQMGKKFSKKSKDEQRNEVMRIIEDVNFVEDMIKLSGFEGFEKSLYTFLNTNDMAKNLSVSNILYDIKQLNDIRNIFSNNDHYDNLKDYLVEYTSHLNKIYLLDENLYKAFLNDLYEQFNNCIKYFINSLNNISLIKDYFDKIFTNIIEVYFNDVKEPQKYPTYLKNKIMKIGINQFLTQKININYFCDFIEKCIDMNMFISKIDGNKEGNKKVEDLLEDIMSNIYENKTFIFTNDTFNEIELIYLIELLQKLDENYIKNYIVYEKFLRFILINYYENFKNDFNELIRKELIFEKENEVIMKKYLSLFLMDYGKNCSDGFSSMTKAKIFIRGLSSKNSDCTTFEYEKEDILEEFYIKFLKKINSVNLKF